MMWNLALDTNHGPKIAGGCENCRGLLTVDTASGQVTTTPEYYALAHLSRAADPGAVITGVQRRQFVTTASFLNPDGEVGIIGFNNAATQQGVVRLDVSGSQALTFVVQPNEYFTVRQTR